MKKYINKGLLYQWFNSSKEFIALGMVIWGFTAYTMFNSHINMTKNDLSYNFDNSLSSFSIYEYMFLGVIFVMIHFAGQGINKRNNAMFLNSAPYTKKAIKYNEIISLIITLFLFVLVFIYVAVMSYLNHIHFLSIVDGYAVITCLEVFKIILFGMLGILFMIIVDSMFSNSIIGLICMVSAIPASIFAIIVKAVSIVQYVAVKDGKNIFELLFRQDNPDEVRSIWYVFEDRITAKEITPFNFSVSVAVTAVIILILFVIYNRMQKHNSLEYSTKIFTSRMNEKIVSVLCSVGAGAFGAMILTENFIYNLSDRRYLALSGMNLFKALGVDFLCMSIIGIVVYIIIKKVLKVVE